MKYLNKDYWNEFYSLNNSLNDPSSFAKEVINNIDNKNTILVDLGCGTGKDTFYFLENNFEAIGIDGSNEVIKNNIDKSKKILNEVSFYCVDLSVNAKVEAVFKEINEIALSKGYNIIFYNRFFLHSISEEVEDILLKNILSTITVPCKIVAEFRSEEDKYLKKVYTDHYRRYINTDSFIKKIIEYGYNLVSFEKGQGYSIYKEEDPYLARVIFELGALNNEK